MARLPVSTNERGFTLVELTVTMSIFSVIIGLAVGLFVSVLNIQLQSQNLRAVQQNTRFAFEEFFREVRVAKGFYKTACGERVDNNSLHIVDGDTKTNLVSKPFIIRSFRDEVIEYKIVNGVFQSINHGKITSCSAAGVVTKLTGEEVRVTSAEVFRDVKYKNCQPPSQVTIRLDIQSHPQNPTRPALNQSTRSELTVSLRSELGNFFPGITQCLP